MRLDGEWHIIRYFRMRSELQPVHIYVTPDNEPIRPDWLAIVHARTWSRRRPAPEDSYVLSFLRDDGHEYDFVQCDTLAIAVDQAKIIAGISQTEWTECHVKIESEDGSFSWADVA
jgi:hypothetical protein